MSARTERWRAADPEHFARVFTSQWGRAAHLLHCSDSPDSSQPAACGKRPLNEWWGTGTQGEYERAARMPLCRECRAAVHGNT